MPRRQRCRKAKAKKYIWRPVGEASEPQPMADSCHDCDRFFKRQSLKLTQCDAITLKRLSEAARLFKHSVIKQAAIPNYSERSLVHEFEQSSSDEDAQPHTEDKRYEELPLSTSSYGYATIGYQQSISTRNPTAFAICRDQMDTIDYVAEGDSFIDKQHINEDQDTQTYYPSPPSCFLTLYELNQMM